jgi:hypothetical protein
MSESQLEIFHKQSISAIIFLQIKKNLDQERELTIENQTISSLKFVWAMCKIINFLLPEKNKKNCFKHILKYISTIWTIIEMEFFSQIESNQLQRRIIVKTIIINDFSTSISAENSLLNKVIIAKFESRSQYLYLDRYLYLYLSINIDIDIDI